MNDKFRADGDHGEYGMLKFTSSRERIFFIAVSRVFFRLRFKLYDACQAAMWAVAVWRILRWQGSDNDLRNDKFWGVVSDSFEVE